MASPQTERPALKSTTETTKKEEMFSNKQSNRWRLAVAAALALMVLATACSASTAPDLESLGLAIETDIQAGSTFELAVPKQPDTIVSVETTPPGVTAVITDGPTEELMLLTVIVDIDTPRGTYNLGLSVLHDNEQFSVNWPFEVVEPGGPTPATVPSTTQPATTDAMLSVESPQAGEIMVSSDSVKGFTSTEQVGYRLSAGGTVLDQGVITSVDGGFESPIVFVNTCCIEMLLEVFHTEAGGLAVTIPLSYPESDPSLGDPAELLVAFGTAWEAADWATMGTLATAPVVDVAREWFIDGGKVDVTADNAASVLDNGWLFYIPPEGFALIFRFAFDATDSGLLLTELTFGGDAG